MYQFKYVKVDKNIPDLMRGTEKSAGIDLYSVNDLVIEPGSSGIVNCGIKAEIPEGYFGHVTIRSGHGFKSDLASHIGVIDSDFRNDFMVKIFNLSKVPFHITAYSRVANLVIVPYLMTIPFEVDSLSETDRTGGFGSTGK